MPDSLAGGHCPRCLLRVALAPEEEAGALLLSGSTRMFADYELVGQIGAGGMGLLYEARRLSDGTRVAIKWIRDFHVTSPQAIRRFKREAELMSGLAHPDIVPVLEAGECDGQPFLVMEFVEGADLQTAVRAGRFSLANGKSRETQRDLARLMARVARAVQHAHAHGVLHRDLKPSNILLTREGEPRLTDFGLAKLVEHEPAYVAEPTLTGSGDAVGTPGYMAPEQFGEGRVTIAADIYSLGAVLYALLTGQPPFQGTTPMEVFRRIAEEQPVPPRVIEPKVEVALEIICLKCLEKDPRHRYASAELLAADLEGFGKGEPISARRASLPRRVSRWARANRVATGVGLSLALGLAASLALLKVVNDQRRAIALDRDQAFDDSMQRVSQLWRDPDTRAVTISARELAILAGRSPAHTRDAGHQIFFAVMADDGPSSMAQRYARLLNAFQEQVNEQLSERAAFHLRLLRPAAVSFKEVLTRGEADVVVMNAAELVRLRRENPGLRVIARANAVREGVLFVREGVLFVRAESGITNIPGLRGGSMAVVADESLVTPARAQLADAGWNESELRLRAHEAPDLFDLVLRGEASAGVAPRGQFERQKFRGLREVAVLPGIPDVLVARAGLAGELQASLRNILASARTDRFWPGAKFTAVEVESSAWLREVERAVQAADAFRNPAAQRKNPAALP